MLSILLLTHQLKPRPTISSPLSALTSGGGVTKLKSASQMQTEIKIY